MVPDRALPAREHMLQPVADRGWRNGLANLVRNELQAWWGTKTWLIQSLVWLVVLNGTTAQVLYSGPRAAALEVAQSVFSHFVGIFGALGVIVSTQGAIVGEKQQGTAAWVLSKPISRVAFLAAKWIGHGLGFFVTIIVVQGALAYAQFAAAGGVLAPFSILSAMGLLTLQLLAYLTLTLMLGTFFASQKVVAGIAVVLLFGQYLLAQAYALGALLPGALPLHVPAVLRGDELPTVIPLIGTVVVIVISALLAIWRFEHEEF